MWLASAPQILTTGIWFAGHLLATAISWNISTPVRIYMREMGTVELLTREGEIVIAKRIEEGLRDVMAALAHYPDSVITIIDVYKRIFIEEGRLSDLFSGYIDPDGEPNPSPINPTTVVKSDDDDDEEETDNGPDPIETAERFAELEDHLVVALLAVEKHGRESKQAKEAYAHLGFLFSPLKLVPKHFESVAKYPRGALARIRAQEKIISISRQRPAGRVQRAEARGQGVEGNGQRPSGRQRTEAKKQSP